MLPTNLYCSSCYCSISIFTGFIPTLLWDWKIKGEESGHKERNNCAAMQRSRAEQGRGPGIQHFKPASVSLHPISQHCLQHKSRSSTKDTQGLENQREIYASVWMAWRLGAELCLKEQSFSWYKLAWFYWHQWSYIIYTSLGSSSEASTTEHFQPNKKEAARTLVYGLKIMSRIPQGSR